MTTTTTDFSTVNFFKDAAIQADPYPYFDWVREQSPVWQEPGYGVYMITGHAEAKEIYRDPATFPEHDAASGTFSSCNAVSGPFVKFSQATNDDDITDVIVACRNELPFSDQIPSFDPPYHTAQRHLLMRLITPGRLRANEEFMWRYADSLLDAFLDSGKCELISSYAEPFTLTVIADLEGVPEADHAAFREHLSTVSDGLQHKPLEFLYERFAEYIEDRRAQPRGDVLTGLATATFPDGTTPEVKDAALIAANLFVGGQETTVRLLSFALRMLGERQDLQKLVRDDRALIPNFIEETLRLESPLRSQFRMTRVRTTLGGVDIPAGSTIMLLPGACNRDPRTFEDPTTFDIHRSNARQHIAFGHGIHTCAGAPLARTEGRVTLERFLERTGNIAIDEAQHGPADNRHYDYLPTFFLRGLQKVHLEFDPV
ncbi:MAG TPA: cytochrome P450 [Mycobacteriales bacterium]|nr:cytochrome P450 [Mycobacteriales bacterium]